jgi:hypothetical protein
LASSGSFISVGVVGILVDFRDWKEYLRSLSDSELTNLQTNTIKALF